MVVEQLEARRMLTQPSIVTSPISQTISDGLTVTFTATANGSPEPSIQWQMSTDGGTSFANIPGATSTPYSFNVTASQNGYQFRAVFTNVDGTATSPAATLTVSPIRVTTLIDENNFTVSPGVGTGTSLREAIAFANSQSGPQSIEFAPGLAGTLNLTLGELPVISGNVTIIGTNAQTIDGQGLSRIFEVGGGGVADLIGLTLTHGNGSNEPNGGGILAGGAILNVGTLTIERSTITGNVNAGNPMAGGGHGGAIDNLGTLTVIGSTFSGNTTTLGNGGGIANYGVLSVTNSTFSGNSAATGGGIENLGQATITNSTFYVNLVTGASQFGRSIFNNGGSLLLTNTIVDSFNYSGSGAAINPASTHNLFVTGGNGLPASGTNGNIVVATASDLHLAALANNGGPTQTVAETAGSPAIGAGLLNTVTSDQRGFGRHLNPDIGAYELVAAGAPVVVTNPLNQSVIVGQTATFSASATGNPIPTVQWQVSTNLGTTYTDIPGATSTTYSFTATLAQSSNLYRAVFTNSTGSVPTSAATLSVSGNLAAPVVTLNPVSQPINAGISVTFKAAAVGNPTPTVQWQQSNDGGVTFTNIAGATSTSFSFIPTSTQNSYQYRAVFTNSKGNATTTAATLFVLAAATAPVVKLNPVSQKIVSGDTVTFTAAATGTPAPTVQWQYSLDGGATYTNYPGATTITFSFVTNTSFDGALFRAVFTNGKGSATSTAAKLTVVPAPIITLNPTSQTVLNGQTVTLLAAATGSPVPSVQWQVSTDLGVTFHNIPGETALLYTFVADFSVSSNIYRALFTNVQGVSAATTGATIVVKNAPTGPVVTQGADFQQIQVGQLATFSATASGDPTPTAQWQISTDNGFTFTNIPGATKTFPVVGGVRTTYSLTATFANSGWLFRAVFTNSLGTATSQAGYLFTYVNPIKPAVIVDPADLTVNAGQVATFTASASGNEAPSVQWQVETDGKTFVDIPGATSTTLSFVTTVSQNGYKYQAVFTNSSGTATSKTATLTVNGKPLVTLNPTDQTSLVGQSVTFTAAADGNPVPTVQWQLSTDGGATYANIASATALTYTFTVAPGQNGSKYRAVFTNSLGTATTTAGTLVFILVPVVTGNPANQTVNTGQLVSFSATASGNPTPSIQWQVSSDGGTTFNDIPGAIFGTYNFTANSSQDGFQYRAVFTNVGGSATTTAATLTVHSPPVVTSNPLSQSIPVGQTVTFVASASGNPVPTVQWQLSVDGGVTYTNINGATSTSLVINTIAGQSGNKYRAAFTNAAGSAITSAATLTLLAPLAPPVIVKNPSSIPFNPGATATFTASASGNPVPTVQWQVSTDGGATFSDIIGATSTSLTFTQTVAQAGYQYRAVFTNSAGVAITTAATLTTSSPVIIGNPANATVGVQQTATFTASAVGTPVPTVQWQLSTDGGVTFTNIPGATSTTYSFTVDGSQNGNKYRAVFTNVNGAAVTLAATLTVPPAGPAVTVPPASQTIAVGKSVTFTAAATAPPAAGTSLTAKAAVTAAPLTIQWQVSTNGGKTFANIAGATSKTLTFATTAGQNGYQYRAVFTSGKTSSTTTAATLTVLTAPVVTTSPVNQTVTNGTSVKFTATATGNATPTVQWQVSIDGGKTFTNIAGATSTTLTFLVTASKNNYQYRAVFTNSVGTATTKIAKLTVK